MRRIYPLRIIRNNAWRSIVVLVLVSVFVLGYHDWRSRQIYYDLMLASSVSIETYDHVKKDNLGDFVWRQGRGSGIFVAEENCEVWTNFHVVKDAAYVKVFPMRWGREEGIPATIVKKMPSHDLAVLHMERCPGVRAAGFGASRALRAGTKVFAVGNPLGRNPDSLTQGIVSHTTRFFPEKNNPIPYLQHDAPIATGNSGGALFDQYARVIGINTMVGAEQGKIVMGLSFALSIDGVREAITTHDGFIVRAGSLMLEDNLVHVERSVAKAYGIPEEHGAVMVHTAPTEGPVAGLLYERDILYKVDGKSFNDQFAFRRLVAELSPGEKISLAIVRGGKKETITAYVGEDDSSREEPRPEHYEGLLGLELQMWAEKDDKTRSRFTEPVITRVFNLSPAHKAGVFPSEHYVQIGPYPIKSLLSVYVVKGVFLENVYREVATPDDVARYAQHAYEKKMPIFLYVEGWGRNFRKNPRNPDLERVYARYFKIIPEPSNARLSTHDTD